MTSLRLNATIAGTTHIDRPLDTVFELLADPRNEPSYNPAILSAAMVTDGPIGAGARFAQQARAFGGGEVAIELLEHDPPSHLGWHVASSGMDVTGDVDLRPDSGGTTVRWTWRLTPLGRLRVLGPLVGAAGSWMEHRVWARVKRHLEEEVAWEVAPAVFCLGPAGRARTNVYFVRTATGWVLVDTAWARDADRIRSAARALFGDDPPIAIVLTHAHPDHSGAAPSLTGTWGCPVFMHPAELPIATGDFEAMNAVAGPMDRWVILPAMRSMGARRRHRVLERGSLAGHAGGLLVGDEVPHLPGWRCVASPGHTPGHLAFLRPADGVLITGDALVTVELNRLTRLLRPGLSEPPWYTTWDRRRARDSIRTLAGHEPVAVLPGHGAPLLGTGTPGRVHAFADTLTTPASRVTPARASCAVGARPDGRRGAQ